ncbi:MAG: thioredoxin family protein [Bacillota bacterium]|nr:thioredoxin family protein [Bacillota bacterium]
MKKLLILLTVSLGFVLFSCIPNDRIVLEPDPDALTWVEIDADTLQAKIDAMADFVLIVSSETCITCADFEPIVESMIATYGVVVYKIEAGAAFPGSNEIFDYRYTPTVAVFKGGELQASTDPAKTERAFESVEHLVDWLDYYVAFPIVE